MDILFKRSNAINEVKEKMAIYSDIMQFGFQSIMDRVPSHSTSVLIMPEGTGAGRDLGNKVIMALLDEESDKEFLKEYTAIISSLSEEQQIIINNRHLKSLTFKELEEGDTMRAGDKRIYKKLNDIYQIIACLDNEIDYSFTDYAKAKVIEIEETKEKSKISKIRDKAISLLRFLYNEQVDIEKANCSNLIQQIPEPEHSLLLDYLEGTKKFKSYEYRRITRAIFTFAYLHQEIEISEEEYIHILKRSGNGWKKYKEEVESKKGLQ